MAALLEGLKTSLYTMNRLKVYMDYVRDLPLALTRTNFESSLTELHALILQFLARAIQIYRKNTLTRAFDAFWKPEDVADFEANCDRIGTQVEIDATNCDRSLNRLERENAAQSTETLQKLLKELKELQHVRDSMEKIESRIGMLWNSSVEDKQAEILEWTSKIPYLDNHLTAGKGRTEGTGEWIFDHSQYQEWRTSYQSMILWLHGIRMSYPTSDDQTLNSSFY